MLPAGIVTINGMFTVNSCSEIGMCLYFRSGGVFVGSGSLIEIFLFELREPLVPGFGRVKRAVLLGAVGCVNCPAVQGE